MLPLPVKAIEFQGKFLQGHFILGKTDPNAKILVGKKEVKVSKDGFFVFGIDRDQKYDLTFTKIINGKKSIITKKVLKRKYNIQRIDGLAESKVTPPESVYKRIKKEKESIRTQLEYNYFYDTQQKEQAMFRLQEIDSYETQGRMLRCHYDQVKTAAKNSRYHSIRARKSFLATKMSAMLTMDNQLKTDQQGIKLACVQYWSHIMRKREIDRQKHTIRYLFDFFFIIFFVICFQQRTSRKYHLILLLPIPF